MGTGLTVTVGGNNITAYVDARTIQIEEVGTERVATCSFMVEDDSGTVSISAKDAVDIRPTGGGASTVLFAGEVSDFRLTRKGITSIWNLSCHDNNILLDERVIEYEYDASGQADSTIIGDLFSEYRSDIDASTYVATVDGSMEAIRFEDMTLREAMDAICQRTGGRYYVDYAKQLHYFDAESGVNASFGLSTSPNGSTTFPFGDFTTIEDGTQLLTHVRVIGEDITGWWPGGGSAPDWSSDERHGISYARDMTTQADLEAHGAEVLAAYQNARVTYECVCWEDGLRAGQYLPLVHAGLSIDDSFYIRSLRVEFLSTDGDLRQYRLELNTESPDPVRAKHQQFQNRAAIGEVEMPVGHRGWIHDLVFSATDNVTVAWTAGTITLADGRTSYSIDSGSVGSISAVTYIYLDIDTSETVLQTTTDDVAAIGKHKIMVCVCQNVADASKYAQFQVFGGKGVGGTFITADNIAANEITANEIAANTITAAEIAADTITADEIAAGTITGTEIAAATITADKFIVGELPFTPDEGLILLGQPLKLRRGTTNYWVASRGQKATVGGAVHPAQGRWQGTQALIIEKSTSNLITNPSVETNTTGWSAGGSNTVAQSSAQSQIGSYSLLCTYQDNNALASYNVTLTATDHSFSVYLYIPANYDGTQLRLRATNFTSATGTLYVNADMNKRGRWQRLTLSFIPDAGDLSGQFQVREEGVSPTAGRYVYVDGAQAEVGDHATTYCDGSLGDGYSWSGTAHGSTSSRTASYIELDSYIGLISANNTLSFRILAQMPYDADATWPGAFHYNVIFDVRGADVNAEIYLWYNDSTDKFYCFINGADRLASQTAETFIAGRWIEFVVTLDFSSDEYYLYVDGELSDSDTTSLSAPTLTDWVIGDAYDHAGTYPGGFAICEFSVFDDVLTAQEIAELHNLDRPLVDYGSSDTPGILLTSHSGNRIEITAYEVAVYQDNDKCVEMDSDGIAILVDEDFEDIRSYQFVDSDGAIISQVEGKKNTTASQNYVTMAAQSVTGYDSYATVEAISPSGELAQAELEAYQGGSSYAVVVAMVTTGGSEEIWHIINGTVHTVTDTTGFRVYSKIYGNNHLEFETGGAGAYAIRPDWSGGSGLLGDSTYYWAEVNYKTLTDRGCLAWFEDGVEMPDGSKVSDLEALKLIRPSEKPSIHGVPQLDYRTFPVACFREGEIAKENIWHDGELLFHAGEKSGADGIEISAFLSIILGAVKQVSGLLDELDARIQKLEGV